MKIFSWRQLLELQDRKSFFQLMKLVSTIKNVGFLFYIHEYNDFVNNVHYSVYTNINLLNENIHFLIMM